MICECSAFIIIIIIIIISFILFLWRFIPWSGIRKLETCFSTWIIDSCFLFCLLHCMFVFSSYISLPGYLLEVWIASWRSKIDHSSKFDLQFSLLLVSRCLRLESVFQLYLFIFFNNIVVQVTKLLH